jgi:hypothetical protein
VKNKAQKWVFAAIKDATASFPFPILGIDSDNGSEFINWELFRWCEAENLTFTRSRSGNKNDGAHVEQKNWHIVRQTVGYHRYDTPAELELLNQIWALQRLLTNHFGRQQKLVSKTRIGAKTIKKHDLPATPYVRRPRRHRHRGQVGQDEAGQGGQAVEPGRDPASDPGPRRRTPDLDHRKTGTQNPDHQAGTLT